MAWIDYYLKIEDLEQLDKIYQKIDLIIGEAKWKNNTPSHIAPITKYHYLAEKKALHTANEEEKDKITDTYLKKNNFKEFLSQDWDNDFMTVGDIICSKGLVKKYPYLLEERIAAYGEKANNTINTEEKWIAVLGGGRTPLKLIEKTCREQKLTAVFNITDDTGENRKIIKVTENDTKIYTFSIPDIFYSGLDPIFYDLQILNESMLKQLITASILYEQHIVGFTDIKDDILINMHKDIKEKIESNDQVLLKYLMHDIEIKWQTIFDISEDQLKQLYNGYSLKQKMQKQLNKTTATIHKSHKKI